MILWDLTRRHRRIETFRCLKVTGWKVSWVLDWKKKNHHLGRQAFRQLPTGYCSVLSIIAETTLTLKVTAAIYSACLVSAAVSLEVSLHQHLEVSPGRRGGGRHSYLIPYHGPCLGWRRQTERFLPPSPSDPRSKTPDWNFPGKKWTFPNEALSLRILHLLLLTTSPSPPSAFSH